MLKIARNIRVTENPYLLFLPFLLLYILFVLIFQHSSLQGDEDRFLLYAKNLTIGYYSPPSHITLGQGPGYSVILTPFLVFDLPLLYVKLMNPLFHYLSIIFLFKALKRIVSFKITMLFCLFWACYYNSFVYMHLIYSEIFTSFLVSLLLFFLVKGFTPDSSVNGRKYIILSGFIMGYIVLTKVIFAYVILILVIILGLLWITKRSAVNYRKGLLVLAVAFITVSPYLIYTYKLTGKIYYWSTYGGENLYWMTTHHEGEYGSWFAAPNRPSNFGKNKDSVMHFDESGYLNFVDGDNLIPGTGDSIISRHQKDFDEITRNATTGLQRDAVFKRIAIRNIKSNPAGYIKNCLSNIGRILFNYPYSYATQRPSTLLRFPLNGIIAFLMIFCIVPTFLNWRKIIFPIRFMLFFILLYLGGSVLGTAETRMFSIIVPMLLFWIAFILVKSVKIKLKFS
jgi:4-amino-4-deoxy-L-arabinose transferase-like glycosyltransferase